MQKHIDSDTICSISTPAGIGGIGIVRMSGPKAVEIARRIFVCSSGKDARSFKGYSIHYGKVKDPGSDDMIDEVLLTVMRAPKTYTREDVVEINCHSGPVVLKKILLTLVHLGARPAEPGEFTKRAFLNGRIDLAQAEAVMALITARTEAGLRVAVRQLDGELSKDVNEVKSDLVHLLSETEAAVDFCDDEDLDLIPPAEIRERVADAANRLSRLIESAEKGKILMEGISTAIVGKANVGKSSLLNRLLKEDRAIVTPFPGTTRDVVEGVVNVDGIPLRILDTAGIRDSKDPVEREGVKRSEKSIDQADLVIMVADISEDPDERDLKIAGMLKDKNKDTVLVLNKTDLLHQWDKNGNVNKLFDILRPLCTVKTSLINNIGLDSLKNQIKGLILREKGGGCESAIVTNARHASALVSAREALYRVLASLERGLSEEFLSVDLRSALEAIGRITGETSTEDILDEIFRCFCVGK